jgi:hypothetical protein
VATVTAVQTQETASQDAALQERVEPVLRESRQVGTGSVLGLAEESRSVLLHRALRCGLFRAVALEVERAAIRRPLALPADGLHARLTRW